MTNFKNQNDDNLVPILKTEWDYEKYSYISKFRLDNVNQVVQYIVKNNLVLNKPDYLYKFYSSTEYNFEALEEGYLYFTSPKYFNDPFDCMTNREEYIVKGGDKIKKHREEIGVCCFSIKNDNPLMWGHYTDNYRGFCLKFKRANILKNEFVTLNNFTSYINEYEPLNKNLRVVKDELYKSNRLNTRDKETIDKILTVSFEYFVKYIDWSYEHEYRAVSFNTSSFERKLRFSKCDLEEIYIGHKMNKDSYERLIKILKENYPNIKVFNIKPDTAYIRLNYKEFII
ncbi:DUF2971 domain-containing protein [Tenacibaculum aiptasiae]|uniref:DUF2971 domain-containing protein n=1 Tax=Tenacibaculum aiptasiae TaxID=426481 RepID=UPI00232E11D9|nr:DUF2971 domain-containing protein [Tenacibaculum aiptasiae]